MSLIPYSAREGREIVLRHRNAIVVRDPASQRLEIRGLSECPTCHQRLWQPDRQFDIPVHHESYVDPDYFRMLRTGSDAVRTDRQPPSPIRRLVQPVSPAPPGERGEVTEEADDAEFISSAPAIQDGSRIRREAFSPNYFKTFFVEERELGRGGKGVVLLVRHEIDGCHLGYFACKRVPVGDDHAWLEKVLIEVELLAKLSHPNLVSYRHVWLEDVKLHRFGPSVACAFILQQYCNSGDLLQYIIGIQPKETTKEDLKAQVRRRSKGQQEKPKDLHSPQRRLSFEEIYSLFKDITSGLAYLHAANYIHRDLKPSNCLLHREGTNIFCLISDFGEVQPENMVRRSTGSTGTISYCAPEVLRRDTAGRYGNFTTKSDIFSLGMILYFMCFGRLPYKNANSVHEELEDIDQLRAEITDWQGFVDERRERPDLPSRLYQLLKKLLALDPAERPSANEVLAAMKSESGTDGVMRGGRSGSPSIGHRIQSLDSPMAPSTPVPDPTKHPRPTSLRDGINGDFLSSAENEPVGARSQHSSPTHAEMNTTRHRAHVMSVSRSQDGPSRVSQQRASPDLHASPTDSPPISTPLLLPPPRTLAGDLRHWARLGWLQTRQVAAASSIDNLMVLVRLSLFLGKMVTLARPCAPFMVDLTVGGFLVALAGMDLVLPRGRVIVSADRGATGRREAAPAPGWIGELRTTISLLGLHVLCLWMASRFGILCAARDERWSDW